MPKAKTQKPLASYYAKRPRMVIGGVPCSFARAPVGPQDRAARMANKLAQSAVGKHWERDAKNALKEWASISAAERIARQDAALAMTPGLPAEAMAPETPASAQETPEAVTMPPEPISLAGGPESEPVAAIEPVAADETPAVAPEVAPEAATEAPEAIAAPAGQPDIAALLRAAADTIEAMQGREAELLAQVEFERQAAECAETALKAARAEAADATARAENAEIGRDAWRDSAANWKADSGLIAADWGRARNGRRRALLALRKARAAYSQDMAVSRREWVKMKDSRDKSEAARIAQKDRADAAETELASVKAAPDVRANRTTEPTPKPVTPTPAPVDPIAQKRALMRRMGIDGAGWRITTPNPATNVRVTALEAA